MCFVSTNVKLILANIREKKVFGVVSKIAINTGDPTSVVREESEEAKWSDSLSPSHVTTSAQIVSMIFTAGHSCHSSWTLEVVLVSVLSTPRFNFWVVIQQPIFQTERMLSC